MKCPECQDLLQKRLDGEPLPTGDALERHLSECQACRELHTSAVCLLDGLKQMPQPRLAPDFARKMASDVMRDRRQRRAKVSRRIFVTVAMAASVVLILLLAYFWIPRNQPADIPNPGQMARKPEPIPPTPPTPPKNETPWPEPKAAPRNALTNLTGRLADTTRDHAKVVLVGTNLDAMEKLPPVNEIPMLDASVRDAGQDVSDSVRTVTRTTRQAFNFFARELPMPDMGEQKN